VYVPIAMIQQICVARTATLFVALDLIAHMADRIG
jgi:hypothetical protein